jgi:hypothetical protein
MYYPEMGGLLSYIPLESSLTDFIESNLVVTGNPTYQNGTIGVKALTLSSSNKLATIQLKKPIAITNFSISNWFKIDI